MSIFYFPKIVFQNEVFEDNIINASEGYKERPPTHLKTKVCKENEGRLGFSV